MFDYGSLIAAATTLHHVSSKLLIMKSIWISSIHV